MPPPLPHGPFLLFFPGRGSFRPRFGRGGPPAPLLSWAGGRARGEAGGKLPRVRAPQVPPGRGVGLESEEGERRGVGGAAGRAGRRGRPGCICAPSIVSTLRQAPRPHSRRAAGRRRRGSVGQRPPAGRQACVWKGELRDGSCPLAACAHMRFRCVASECIVRGPIYSHQQHVGGHSVSLPQLHEVRPSLFHARPYFKLNDEEVPHLAGLFFPSSY